MELYTKIAREFSGRQAWRYADRIAQYNRIQASPGYREAAMQIVSLLKRDGIEVKIEEFPAKSGERFLSRQSFQEWRCHGGELWLLNQDGNRQRRLARYQEQELSLVQRSGPTPPEGLRAELMEVANASNPETYQDLDVRGKLLLVQGNPTAVHRLAVEEHGAAGLIFDNLNSYPPLRTREDLPDAIQYTSFWWLGQQQPGFGFCVSPRVAGELRQMLGQGPVNLFAHVDAELMDGKLENVEYFIPGQREQEILLLAHLCHPYPGAQDNASGPAVLMEVMRTLQRLLELGDLQQPELGIRFLMVPEMTGTFAYFHHHPQRRDKTVAAFNLDMVGADQRKGGGPLCIEQPPLGTPTVLDRYAYDILQSFANEYRNFTGTNEYGVHYFLNTRFSGGSDHYVVADPSIGIPCPMAIQWPDKHYHTSMDHPDNLDPHMLKRVGIMTALYAWGLAQGEEDKWIEFLFRDVSQRGAHLHNVLEWTAKQQDLAGQWAEVLDFHLDYEVKALEQLAEYARLRCFSQLEEKICWAQGYMQEITKQVREWACQRFADKTSPDFAQLDAQQAAKVYRRAYAGPLDINAELTRLPRNAQRQWTEYMRTANVSSNYSTFILYWLDGKRPLAEVLELVKLESGKWHPQYAVKFIQLCQQLDLIHQVL